MTSIISTRSTLRYHRTFTPASSRRDLVKLRDGHYCDVNQMNLVEKLRNRNSDLYTISTQKQTLTIYNTLNVNGFRVSTKLRMVVAPDLENLNVFLTTFYGRRRTVQITLEALAELLGPEVRAAVAGNLAYVNVVKVPPGSRVKSAARHAKLGDICRAKGLHLFVDELTLEVIS